MAEVSHLCPACGQAVEGSARRASCLRCQNVYHIQCWEALPGCMAFGCPGIPEEGLQDLERPRERRPCPVCKHDNPSTAPVCLSCGERLAQTPARAVFTSLGGWQATTPEDLVLQLDRHWETGVHHLYNGDLEGWFGELGRQDLLEAARGARHDHEQHSVGLESFLQASGVVEPPQVEVLPESLDLEGPGPILTGALEIRNLGRGYLAGQVTCDATWLSAEPTRFTGNKSRIVVTIDVRKLPEGPTSTVLRLTSTGPALEVPVRARRVGIEGALVLYRDGDTVRARALCRKLMDAQASLADAAVLTAACYLAEDNATSAVHALRNLVGACQALPSEVVEAVFRWLGENDPAAAGVERVGVYEALIPCAEGRLGSEIRRTLAQAAMETARQASAAFRDNNTSLWKGRTATTEDVIELLEIASGYDPSLANEAASLKKQLRQKVKRGRMAVNLTLLLVLVALAAALGGSWLWTWKQMRDLHQASAQALQSGDYEKAVTGFRTLLDGDPDNQDYRLSLVRALLMQTRQADEACEPARSRALLDQARELCAGRPLVQPAVAALLLEWAADLEKKGLVGEARIRLEQAWRLDSNNARAQALLSRVAAETDLYLKAHELAEGALGQQPLESYRDLGEISTLVEGLVSAGMVPYEGRMMVVFVDVTGDGAKELVVAGTKGQEASASGHLVIYSVGRSALKAIHTAKVAKTAYLMDLQARDFSGERRADLVTRWVAHGEGDVIHTVLLACKNGRFLEEVVPSDLVVDLGDRNHDRRGEIWIGEEIAQSTGKADRVIFYRPYLWNEPGLEKASGDYRQYYLDYKSGLEQQMGDNPYPSADPRHANYRRDRQKGIEMAERALETH